MKIVLLLMFILGLGACGGANSKDKIEIIHIAAAASTQYALDEIIAAFEKKHEIAVHKIISSSGKLTAQIENGAPIDLFISADTKYPDYLHQKKRTIGAPIIYAKGRLVAWTFQKNIALHLDSLDVNSIHKIALADPKTAPYGALAQRWLEGQELVEKFQGKIIYGESIAQVNQYVTTQTVSIGLTAKSIIMAPKLKGKGRYLELPNAELEQSMVLLKEKGRLFFEFMQGKEAQQILSDFGYEN